MSSGTDYQGSSWPVTLRNLPEVSGERLSICVLKSACTKSVDVFNVAYLLKHSSSTVLYCHRRLSEANAVGKRLPHSRLNPSKIPDHQ